MLKASALYMVIVIALVIGILCSSLVVTAYYFRLQNQRTNRYLHLQNNLSSAVNILIAGADTTYGHQQSFSLFNTDQDSVSVEKIAWGIYDVGIAQAFINRDTLYRTFSMARTIDSSKWAVIYFADNERPLALSGKTEITGNAFLPAAGVNQAYLNNSGYTGDKRLIVGNKYNSAKLLPVLSSERLQKLHESGNQIGENESALWKHDTLKNSFLQPTRVFNLGKTPVTLKNICLSGNIVLIADTSLIIDSTARLDNVLIFAQSITVDSSFHGKCQLFARDTISIQQHCRFDYPSVLGILRYHTASVIKTQAKISLQRGCLFNGTIFTYEQDKNPVPPLISVGKAVAIKGQIYAQGTLEFNDGAEVDGSVFTAGFLYQTAFTRYENYINNTTISSPALSPYYLSSDLLPVTTSKKKVLQWLEAN